MSQSGKVGGSICLSLLVALLTFTGCENGNLFGKIHKSGSGNDPVSLVSDAESAYRAGDYSRSLELYNQALEHDPSNVAALYGAAAAATAGAGLNLTLISNVLKQTSTASSVRGMGDLVARGRVGGGGTVSTRDILSGINTTALKAVLDLAICRLQKIASGITTETAPKKDLDLLINYAVLRLLRAVITAKDNDLLVVNNANGTYSIAAGAVVAGGCVSLTQAQSDALVSIATDLALTYEILATAVANSSANSSLLADIRDDMATVNEQLLTAGSTIPQACINPINAAGITLANFTSYTGAFVPPTGC